MVRTHYGLNEPAGAEQSSKRKIGGLKMGSHKSSRRKTQLMKKIRQNSAVPTWIIVRTNRRVRSNPQRRSWRRRKLKIA